MSQQSRKRAAEMSAAELARYIDYSVLKPEFTESEIRTLTADAVRLGCATVCINPGYIELCEPLVAGSGTSICPVCDFPFGTSSTASKAAQIGFAARSAAVREIDVVANFGLVKGGNLAQAARDIEACAAAAHQAGKELKVIFETDALDETQIRALCRICAAAQADFVKTSTGFLTGYELHGATEAVIRLMMAETAGKCRVKGSGSIRTREHFLSLIDMGIDRMGIGYKSVPVVLGL